MLSVQGVSKTFHEGTPDEVRALAGVGLDVAEGSFTVVVGTNGSGKSTLLNAIAGTFPVDAGSIRLGGRDVTRWPEHRRAALVGRVFQNPGAGTAPGLSIAENLALAARRGLARGLRLAAGRALVAEMRERVRGLGMGLEDRLGNAMGGLSGGQRQALTLLMATWRRPRLLLLDEPTAALDPKAADQVAALAAGIAGRDRLTTLLVTHSMAQAVRFGDRLVLMHRGRILHDYQGAEKRRLRAEDLLDRFEAVRRAERLDESAAELLRRHYV